MSLSICRFLISRFQFAYGSMCPRFEPYGRLSDANDRKNCGFRAAGNDARSTVGNSQPAVVRQPRIDRACCAREFTAQGVAARDEFIRAVQMRLSRARAVGRATAVACATNSLSNAVLAEAADSGEFKASSENLRANATLIVLTPRVNRSHATLAPHRCRGSTSLKAPDQRRCGAAPRSSQCGRCSNGTRAPKNSSRCR